MQSQMDKLQSQMDKLQSQMDKLQSQTDNSPSQNDIIVVKKKSKPTTTRDRFYNDNVYYGTKTGPNPTGMY